MTPSKGLVAFCTFLLGLKEANGIFGLQRRLQGGAGVCSCIEDDSDSKESDGPPPGPNPPKRAWYWDAGGRRLEGHEVEFSGDVRKPGDSLFLCHCVNENDPMIAADSCGPWSTPIDGALSGKNLGTYDDIESAYQACENDFNCAGVTKNKDGKYEAREGPRVEDKGPAAEGAETYLYRPFQCRAPETGGVCMCAPDDDPSVDPCESGDGPPPGPNNPTESCDKPGPPHPSHSSDGPGPHPSHDGPSGDGPPGPGRRRLRGHKNNRNANEEVEVEEQAAVGGPASHSHSHSHDKPGPHDDEYTCQCVSPDDPNVSASSCGPWSGYIKGSLAGPIPGKYSTEREARHACEDFVKDCAGITRMKDGSWECRRGPAIDSKPDEMSVIYRPSECGPSPGFGTTSPSMSPTRPPTMSPTRTPVDAPTPQPVPDPTQPFQPTDEPTDPVTEVPTGSPTEDTAPEPSNSPTPTPTDLMDICYGIGSKGDCNAQAGCSWIGDDPNDQWNTGVCVEEDGNCEKFDHQHHCIHDPDCYWEWDEEAQQENPESTKGDCMSIEEHCAEQFPKHQCNHTFDCMWLEAGPDSEDPTQEGQCLRQDHICGQWHRRPNCEKDRACFWNAEAEECILKNPKPWPPPEDKSVRPEMGFSQYGRDYYYEANKKQPKGPKGKDARTKVEKKQDRLDKQKKRDGKEKKQDKKAKEKQDKKEKAKKERESKNKGIPQGKSVMDYCKDLSQKKCDARYCEWRLPTNKECKAPSPRQQAKGVLNICAYKDCYKK